MKTIPRLPIAILACALFTLAAIPRADALPVSVAAINEIPDLTPAAGVFDKNLRKEPAVVKTLKDAEALFDEASLAKLKEAVDFEKQVVLVFAWRGSGQDKLTFDVAESDPEQITFKRKPGMTRDLRPRFFVFALRSDVTWSVK